MSVCVCVRNCKTKMFDDDDDENTYQQLKITRELRVVSFDDMENSLYYYIMSTLNTDCVQNIKCYCQN